MSKAQLFEILDGLERRTLPIMEQARARLAREKGSRALDPWNQSQALAGDATRALDRFFPFENAVDVWARSFAALGLTYSGGEMVLDLCDRPAKYSNGFCAWPQPSYRRADGAFVPARANFTSLATPSAVGSGLTALTTLLHEGGHAAHFRGRGPGVAPLRAGAAALLRGAGRGEAEEWTNTREGEGSEGKG